MKKIIALAAALVVLGVTGYLLRKQLLYLYARNKAPLKLDGKFMAESKTEDYDVDTGFYAYLDGRCRGLGLEWVGDMRDANFKQTFVKAYRNEDGTIIATGFSVKTPGNLVEIYGDYINISEMNSESKAGLFYITSTADFSNPIMVSPKIKKVFVKYGTDPDSIYSLHMKRMSGIPELRSLSTLEDVIQAADREKTIERDFREGNEKVSIQEIKEIDEQYQRKLESPDMNPIGARDSETRTKPGSRNRGKPSK